MTQIQDHEYVCSVWFERDRTNVTLETPDGREIFSLWDDDVHEAIDDGFLPTPRGPLMSSRLMNDSDAWRPCAVEYARSQGLI
mgnify:CR=1 FL=1